MLEADIDWADTEGFVLDFIFKVNAEEGGSREALSPDKCNDPDFWAIRVKRLSKVRPEPSSPSL